MPIVILNKGTFNPTHTQSAYAGLASGTGVAQDLLPSVLIAAPQVGAGQAAGSGSAFDPQVGIDISVVAQTADGAGAAFGASVAQQVFAQAIPATGTGQVLSAQVVLPVSSTAQPATASGVGTAYGPIVTGTNNASPDTPSGSGVAFGASISAVSFINANVAVGTGAAFNPSTAINSNAQPQPAVGAGAAYPVTKAPSRPASPTLSGSAGDSVVNLTWTTPFNNGAPITGYTVIRNLFQSTQTSFPLGNVNSYADTTVADGTTYTYTVTATNSAGTSGGSNVLMLTPTAPVTSVTDIPNSDGAWRMMAFGGYSMIYTDTALWATRGFGGYMIGLGGVDGFGGSSNSFRGSSALNPRPPGYGAQGDIELNFDPGAAGCEGYLKFYIRDTTRQHDDLPPFDWFNNTSRTAWQNRWNDIGAFQQWRGHGMAGGGADTEVCHWGLNYQSAVGSGVRDSHTDAQITAQIRSWGYAHGQGLFQAMPNAVMLVYNWTPRGGFPARQVYNFDETLDGRAWVPSWSSPAPATTYWYGYEAPGPKHEYWVGFAQAMADFGGPGARLVSIQAFFYKPGSQKGGVGVDAAYKYETQGSIAEFSTHFTAAQWSKIWNKVDFSFFSWMATDVFSFYQITGAPAFANQLAKMRQYGMGPRRAEYCYENSPERVCYYDTQHRAKEQPAGVLPGAGFYFQENNFYLVNPGDLPRYSFSDYNMDFPAFGNPPGGHLAGMQAAKNRSSPLNTQVPFIRDTAGNFNTVTKTYLGVVFGVNVYQIAGRVSHPNGCRGAVCWNITQDPNRISPRVAPLTWNQNGGTPQTGYPNDYLAFQINLPADPGDHIIVQAVSVHDQTHNLEIVL